MTPRIDLRSPNFKDRTIAVEFLLIHYTAGDFERALSHFLTTTRPVSCHLLIAEDGEVFELVECWEGKAKMAFHAGESRYATADSTLEGFNEFSLGIEIVNFNGNLVPFSDAQYEGLCSCLDHLKRVYPALSDPNRILGHEDVAGWRGKADPGRQFDWHRVFSSAYPGQPHPNRYPVCPQLLADALTKFLPVVPSQREDAVLFWHALNASIAAAVKLQFSETGLTNPRRLARRG